MLKRVSQILCQNSNFCNFQTTNQILIIKIMVPHEILGKNLHPINSAKFTFKSEITLMYRYVGTYFKTFEYRWRNICFWFQVAWVRVDTQTILTIHNNVITRNPRISLKRPSANEWILQLQRVQPNDRGWWDFTLWISSWPKWMLFVKGTLKSRQFELQWQAVRQSFDEILSHLPFKFQQNSFRRLY